MFQSVLFLYVYPEPHFLVHFWCCHVSKTSSWCHYAQLKSHSKAVKAVKKSRKTLAELSWWTQISEYCFSAPFWKQTSLNVVKLCLSDAHVWKTLLPFITRAAFQLHTRRRGCLLPIIPPTQKNPAAFHSKIIQEANKKKKRTLCLFLWSDCCFFAASVQKDKLKVNDSMAARGQKKKWEIMLDNG